MAIDEKSALVAHQQVKATQNAKRIDTNVRNVAYMLDNSHVKSSKHENMPGTARKTGGWKRRWKKRGDRTRKLGNVNDDLQKETTYTLLLRNKPEEGLPTQSGAVSTDSSVTAMQRLPGGVLLPVAGAKPVQEGAKATEPVLKAKAGKKRHDTAKRNEPLKKKRNELNANQDDLTGNLYEHCSADTSLTHVISAMKRPRMAQQHHANAPAQCKVSKDDTGSVSRADEIIETISEAPDANVLNVHKWLVCAPGASGDVKQSQETKPLTSDMTTEQETLWAMSRPIYPLEEDVKARRF